jgi:hypothetical protein
MVTQHDNIMNSSPVISLDKLTNLSLEEFLETVLKQGTALTIQLPTGETVTVEPRRKLSALPILNGAISDGWKDAIYP